MTEFKSGDEYIETRVNQYIGWYDAKSGTMKRTYLRYRTAAVVGGALIPVATNIQALPGKDYIVSVLGLLVVILVSLDSVYHWGDQWKNYRSTEQVLGREIVFYRSRVGPYTGLDEELASKRLVERCEEAIAVENTATLNVLSIQQSGGGTDTSQ